ncbi:MAG: twin-arginine translocase TatA/TatE family subunit [Alphaproteobacteria bacterium]|nr:twin-arginine translocase TatA/TatE family subunit [Alphaproteobacteria bacterium]MBP7729209.1 twin-arginine translocase TatA/TatE family subunit [Alphaproteobacteria bacterium]
MGLSLSHLLLVLITVLLVFGAGRLPSIMKDLAKGLKSFKEGLREGEEKPHLLTKSSTPENEP